MKKVIFETSNSHSAFFQSFNAFASTVNGSFLFYSNRPTLYRMRRYFPDFLVPKIAKTSVCMMPDLFYGFGETQILWIHDTLVFEEYFIYGMGSDRLSYERKRVVSAAKSAQVIITVSEYSKGKIVKYIGINPDKIHVIPCQIQPEPYIKYANDSVLHEKIKRSFSVSVRQKNIIFIGSPHFRKNLKTALEVFRLLKTKVPWDLRFFVVSYARDDIPATKSVYDYLRDMEGVTLVSALARDELIALLSMCDLLLNPTLEEGFGLPNIEAQICSVPVVSSNISCIPEVLGDSALLVDPLDVMGLTDACSSVLNQEIEVDTLIERGRTNAQRFTDVTRYSEIFQFLQV